METEKIKSQHSLLTKETSQLNEKTLLQIKEKHQKEASGL